LKAIFQNTFLVFIFLIITGISLQGQINNTTIFKFDSLNFSNVELFRHFCRKKTNSTFPIKAGYAPHLLIDDERIMGTGECDYVCIPLKNLIKTGLEYNLEIAFNLSEAYFIDSFSNQHFGFTLLNKLPNKSLRLWNYHFHNIKGKNPNETNKVSINFRSLCEVHYLVIGVFRNPEYPAEFCDLCWYNYEISNISINENTSTAEDMVYFCDVDRKSIDENDTEQLNELYIYYDLNSANISQSDLDKIKSFAIKNLKNTNIIELEASTDKSGSQNFILAEQRGLSVKKYLIKYGIDSSRIIIKNIHDLKSTDDINQNDRYVKISKTNSSIAQKLYSEAIASSRESNHTSTAMLFGKWLKEVNLKNIIYALFDCRLSSFFKSKQGAFLMKNIRQKYYYDDALRFKLDSIWCEDQRPRTLDRYIKQNQLNLEDDACFMLDYETNNEERLIHFVDSLIGKNGIPEIKKVAERGQQALLYIIIHSTDIAFQKKCLPIVYNHCNEGKVPWRYYAMLYDKISLKENKYQRYGTQIEIDDKGNLIGYLPLEDVKKVNELRKQVKLPPIN
jgi:OmpA family